MNIQFLNGGLGNQVFQYIFSEYARLTSPTKETWYLDDSFYFTDTVHNGYELESAFGLKPALLSNAFDPDVRDYLLDRKKKGISIPQSLKDLGFPVTVIAEYDNYKQWNPFDGPVTKIPPNAFLPELAGIRATEDSPDEIFYTHGYFLNPGYFNAYRDHFLSLLSFRPLDPGDHTNREYEQQILSSRSVGVHIRRGDYVTLGFDTGTEFYRNAMDRIRSSEKDPVFFVFSDDIPWCKAHAEELGLPGSRGTVFVEGNMNGRNRIDLYLMSLCRIIVFGRSSFAQLASMLDTGLAYCISELNIPS